MKWEGSIGVGNALEVTGSERGKLDIWKGLWWERRGGERELRLGGMAVESGGRGRVRVSIGMG